MMLQLALVTFSSKRYIEQLRLEWLLQFLIGVIVVKIIASMLANIFARIV